MPMRLSGLMSGMDTESIVSQLVEARKEKVTKTVKAQKTLKYKQDAWKDLNKQILNLYNKSLNNMRFESSFVKKTTKVSNSNVVSVITGENAMNSVQTLKVNKLAKTGFLTGGKIELADWAKGEELTGDTTLGDLGLIAGENANMNITFKDGRDTESISVTANTTINSFVSSLREAGLTVNFDANNGRIFMASKQSGAEQDFNIVATNVAGMEALSALKLNYTSVTVGTAEMTKNIDARVDSLLNSYNNALAQQTTLGNVLRKYSDKIGEVLKVNGVDFDTLFDNGKLKEMKPEILEKVEHAIDVVVKEAEENRQPNTVNDLKGWMSSWKKSVATIENVTDKYGAYLAKDADGKIKLDADGKASWDTTVTVESKTIKQKVAANLEKEVSDYNNTVGKTSENRVEDIVQERLNGYADQRTAALDSMKKQQETLLKPENWDQIKAKLKPEDATEIENALTGDAILTDEQFGKVKNAIQAVTNEAGQNSDVVKELKSSVEKWTESKAALTEAENYIKDGPDGTVVWKDDATEAAVRADAKEYINGVMPTKQNGEDSQITLNGVAYNSSRNTFEVNGLTLTVNALTDPNEEVTITTEDDVSGIYDMVKNFIKEYSTLINQMDKYYNADSAKGYDPLTDEEKEAMSDSAIEEWENKIKESILRKDSTLGTFSGEMKRIMMEGVEVNGKMMYLSNFGIGTLNYFSAADNEKNAYHIDGDPDDESTSGNPDKLKSMIANDPDTVVSFFTQLSKNLYSKMFDMMKGVEGVSSSMTAYEDKKMQSDYDDYTVKIKELEKKLAEYEDKWYAKFAAMETALAKMQNNASAVTSLLGG